MRVFVCAVVLVFLLQCCAIGKKHKMKTSVSRNFGLQHDDPLLEVEPLPPDASVGQCNCVCCEPSAAPLVHPKCPNDIVIAVDSSACFRDHHSRMMRFLKKLVRRIGRTKNIQYGADETRLALMQFSSDIIFPLELSSFEYYTNPATRKGIMDGINEQLESLRFLGEGSFLNKALNATADQIRSHPRPLLVDGANLPPRPVVILLTNGKSHPTVTMDDIEYSIADLEDAGITVLPVSVTRECHGVQSDGWNEGLCPDTIVLNKLAKVGRPDTSTFLEMRSQDTMAEIIQQLEECFPPNDNYKANTCNNCTCSCELPIGPQGPPGPRGTQGDFVEGEPGKKGDVGPKGEDGEDGKPGEKGDKGPDGEKGDVGSKGDTGEDGLIGEKGQEGAKGENGTKGEPGEAGDRGRRGVKGENGEKGESGDKGEVGEKGETGRNGTRGLKGETGSEGAKGEKGVGEEGERGPPGPRGGTGKRGTKGRDGEKGMKGPRGLCGTPGPAGKPGVEGIGGVDGIDGQNGPPGSQGERGEPGVEGDKGERGDFGLPGIPGTIGLTGERGPVGPEGERGVKGEKGEPSSEPGPIGPSGVSGEKGMKGADGRSGLNGPEGPPGRQGPRGEPGERGPAGTYDLEQLRPLIVDIIRELLPGDCGDPYEPAPPEEPEEPTPPDTDNSPTTSTPPDGDDVDDICSQLPPFGQCTEPGVNNYEGKYYWNTILNTCVLFSYKGCPGGNVFDTESGCETRCRNSITTSTPSLPPTLPAAPGCYQALSDVAFVLDGSASVGEEGFAFLQDFLVSVVSAFHGIGVDGVQVGLLQYNDEPRFELQFDECTSKEVALNAINNMTYLSGNTQTGHALHYLSDSYKDLHQEERANVKRVVVVITDGRSQDAVKRPSSELKKAGVAVFAIGSGEAEYIELKEIASTPTNQFVYNVTDYAAISSIKQSTVERICEEAGGTYKTLEEEVSIDDEVIFPDNVDEKATTDTPEIGSGEKEEEEA